MKRHMRVEWHHDLVDEPIVIYSEVENGYEVRKIEVYRCGRADYADGSSTTGSTQLAEDLLPTVDDLAGEDEFTASVITEDDFSRLWQEVTTESRVL